MIRSGADRTIAGVPNRDPRALCGNYNRVNYRITSDGSEPAGRLPSLMSAIDPAHL